MATSPLPYHRDDLERVLLARAGEIVAAAGPEALSLRELGRRADVSRAAPYHYFPTKAALLHRLGELGFGRLAERIAKAMEEQAEPADKAVAGFLAYLAFARGEPAIFELMFANRLDRGAVSEGSYPFSSESARHAFAILLDGVRSLDPDSAEASVMERVNMLWAYAHGVCVLAIGDNLKGVEAETLLRRGIATLLAAMPGR